MLVSILTVTFATSPNAEEAGGVIKWSDNGLRFEIAPLGTDQVRAFFIGRGFSAENADFIATTGCVFRSAIGSAGKSPADPPVTVSLTEWTITHRGTVTSPKTRDDWKVDWAERQADEDAQTAFHWALFPTRQTFSPSDYNWGMISFALLPSSRFDLDVVWHTEGQGFRQMIEGLTCGQ